MPDIISIGECFVELMSPDPLADAVYFEKAFSGDTLSVLTMASKLGTSCGYITRVSDDPLGDFLLESWGRLDIDTSRVKQVRGFNAFEFSSPTSVAEGQKVYYRTGSVASGLPPSTTWDRLSASGFSNTGFMSTVGSTPAASACTTCARPISWPSRVT